MKDLLRRFRRARESGRDGTASTEVLQRRREAKADGRGEGGLERDEPLEAAPAGRHRRDAPEAGADERGVTLAGGERGQASVSLRHDGPSESVLPVLESVHERARDGRPAIGRAPEHVDAARPRVVQGDLSLRADDGRLERLASRGDAERVEHSGVVRPRNRAVAAHGQSGAPRLVARRALDDDRNGIGRLGAGERRDEPEQGSVLARSGRDGGSAEADEQESDQGGGGEPHEVLHRFRVRPD